MAVQYSTAVRNAFNDAIETAIGTAPLIKMYSGSMPANCATAASGTNLANGTLPSDWLSASSGGVKSQLGTWSLTGAAAGNIGYYRILDSTGTTCHEQGTITATGGGGDMTVDNVSVTSGQSISITGYTKTADGA